MCKNSRAIALVVLAIWSLGSITQGQELTSKLSQSVDFVPKDSTTLEQLVQLDRHYHIPMGIEWVDESPFVIAAEPAQAQSTVADLINSILTRSPRYSVTTGDGILHVGQPSMGRDPKNFLNIRIPKFEVKNESLLGAEFNLKPLIDMAVHPEKYVGPHGYNGGYGGGYGSAPDDPFWVSNISFSGNDLTVRQILDRIALGNGNALWVVHLNPSMMMAAEPFYAQGPLREEQAWGGFQWQFIHMDDNNRRN